MSHTIRITIPKHTQTFEVTDEEWQEEQFGMLEFAAEDDRSVLYAVLDPYLGSVEVPDYIVSVDGKEYKL